MIDQDQNYIQAKEFQRDTFCYHCGEVCENDLYRIEEKHFCCQGCQLVYEILEENDLCRYYELDEQAGVSLKGRRNPEYAFLDEEEIREKMLLFRSAGESRVEFFLPQIHCASCIWLLENLHKLKEGILRVRVNFSKREVVIGFREAEISLREIAELLDSIGYAPEIRLESLEGRVAISDRDLFIKMGVAGFAFGNIMLFSFPEYLGLEHGIDGQYAIFFSYLNLLLAIPVLFYSGWDYLRSAWQGVRHGILNIDVPIALGMLALFGRSFFEIISGTGAGYIDSLAGLVFFLLIGKWFQQRTFRHISFERDYRSYFPIAVNALRQGIWKPVPLHRIETGDELLVKQGEIIAADSLLIDGKALVDYSFVTGESRPVSVKEGERIYAGGRQEGSSIRLRVIKKPSQSYLIQLWDDEAFSNTNKTRASMLADRVGKYFTLIILTIAFATLFYWLRIDAGIAINAFTAVLIIACPCAVALSIPFTFGNVMRILASKGFYLKSIRVVERFRYISDLVLDKTGTLTRLSGYNISFEGNPLSSEESSWIKSLASESNHPVSRKITAYFNGSPLIPVSELEETPGSGVSGRVAGHCVRIGTAAFTSAREGDSRGGTVIAVDGQERGTFYIRHAYRTGLEKVLVQLASMFKLSLISGDDDREKSIFRKLLGPESDLRFRMLPKDKLQFVRELQDANRKVAMLGDGLNDAGALKQSDIGIVISEDLNNFSPACDAIMDAGQFEHFPRMIHFTRKSMNLVFAAYLLAAVYNIVGLSFAVQGALSPVIAAILMPASSISIVLFGILSSNILAWKMGLINFGEPDTTEEVLRKEQARLEPEGIPG